MGRRKAEKPSYKDPVDLYKKIYRGEIERFPSGYFLYDTDNAAVREIVRFFVADILGYRTRKDILMNIRRKDFERNQLGGMLGRKYKSSPSLAVMDAFPELSMQPWEFHECHNNYWSGEGGEERAIAAFQHVFFEWLGLFTKEEIKPYLNNENINKIGLHGAFKRGFQSNLPKCAEKCFPGMFQPWELGDHVSNGYWTKEKGAQTLKWLFEEKLQYSREDILQNFTREFAKEYQLYGMMQRCFNNSISEALLYTYPDEFKVWEMSKVSSSYWTNETIMEALNWAIYEKWKITPEEASKLRQKDFFPLGLYSLIMYEKMPVKQIISKYFLE